MSDQADTNKTDEQNSVPNGAAHQQASDLPITVHAQYVRDISFENPDAPHALRSGQAGPEIAVNIHIEMRPIESESIQHLFEVSLTLSATAKRGDKTVFIAEVIYGTTVSLGSMIPENQRHPVLFIEIPRMAFPFARQILSDITAQGGYPAVLINPVDFQALYMERFKNELAHPQQATEQAGGAVN